MNKFKLHKLLSNMVDGIERDKLDAKSALQILAQELKDPFVNEIDEFLIEKSSKQHPQDDAEDELKEESLDYKEPTEQEHPQDMAIDELKDETVEYEAPVEADNPQEESTEKVIDEIKDEPKNKVEPKDKVESKDETEDDADTDEEKLRAKKDEVERQLEELRDKKDKKDVEVESMLMKISNEVSQRGYKNIANKFIMASSKGIVEILNNLLMKEFQIRDILENYSYLFLPEEAKKAAQHKPRESILYLQKHIIAFDDKPTTQRLTIPAINPAKSEGVLALVKEHENRIIADYFNAIKAIETEEKYLTLKIMFERIIQAKSQLRDGIK